LMHYAWPGNVRELKSAFEYAFVTCQETMIQPCHLPPGITNGQKILKITKPQCSDRLEMKRKQLVEALDQTDWNQSEAAHILGISRVTVWNRMRRFGISAKREPATEDVAARDEP
jgi:two-component system response regulator HydG